MHPKLRPIARMLKAVTLRLALLVTRAHKILCCRKHPLSITYEFYFMLSTLLREMYVKYFNAVPMSVV